MTEIWKQYEDSLYYVSNWGQVKSLYRNKEIIIKPQVNHKGYLMANLRDKKMFIHRLVAITFLGLNPARPFVNHKNAIKTDNRLENLEWCTHTENNAHAVSIGLGTPSIECIAINLKNEIIGEYPSQNVALKTLGYKKNAIIISKLDFNDAYRAQMIADRTRARKQFVMSDRTLNREQVLFIREMLDTGKYTPAYIGRLFNVEHSVIHGIKKGRIYKDILTK